VKGTRRYPGYWLAFLGSLVPLLALAALAFLVAPRAVDRVQPTTPVAVTVFIPAAKSTPPTMLPSPTPTPSPTITPTKPPTSTPTPSPSPTSTPTVSPTPTSTSTPTPVPSVRLSEGRRLQRNGDYTAARRVLADLLRDVPAGPEAPEARFRLAQCYLLDGFYVEAAAAFQIFLDEYPDDPRRAEAFFLLGEARAGMGEWDGAIAAYEAYLALAGDTLADVVLERIADAHRARGRSVEALAAYEAALAASSDLATSRRLHRAMAEVLWERGDYEEALAQYRALRRLARTSAQRAEAELRQAEVLQAAGRSEEAEARFRAAMDAEPRSVHAYAALKALLSMGAEVDDYQRGVIDYHNGAYWPALEAFRRHMAADPEGYKPEAHDYIARTYLALGLPDLAAREWLRLIEGFPRSDIWGRAWLNRAEALHKGGQAGAARQLLLRFARENPEHPLAPEALALAAQWAERAGDYETAAEEYAALQRRYPRSEQASSALFQAALNRYRLQEYAQAIALWQMLLEEYDGYRPQSTLFWLGKTWLAAGEREEAGRAWEALLEAAPEGYYALRARELAQVAGLELSSPPDALDGGAGGQAAAEEWLRSWLPGADGTDLRALPAAVVRDGAYRRGVALLALGLRREALRELEGVKDRWLDDPQAMYALALHFRELGVYRLSIVCAARLLDLSPLSLRAAAPRFLLGLAYPTYFADLVQEEAETHGLDPLLLYAVIRQESLFEPAARSYAAAGGLMQVIPATGEWVAQRLHWPDYRGTHVYRPHINIKFGVYYLAYAMEQAGNNVMTALVGYNAGPGNARHWRAAAGEDDDLFLETVTNPQPRRYVRNVLQQLGVYRQLYGKGQIPQSSRSPSVGRF